MDFVQITRVALEAFGEVQTLPHLPHYLVAWSLVVTLQIAEIKLSSSRLQNTPEAD